MWLRLLALIALALTIASFAYGAFGDAGGLISLGQLWYDVSPDTLNLSQAVTQRYIWPPLWDPGALWLLEKPAVAVFGVLALIFIVPALMRGRR